MAPPPHPWAGRSGEGPPIAPPNWKWRAGNRISDMYFYSPSGKQFRSRPELASYLQTLNNPPDARLFCWRVTAEVLKNGFIPRDDVLVPTKPAQKRKAQSPLGAENKRMKAVPRIPFLQPGNSYGQPSTSYGQALVSAVQPMQGERAALMPSGLNVAISSPFEVRDSKKGKRVRLSLPRSFKNILAGRSSFKWLYDSETLGKFLEEARRLKNKSAAEINEIRKVVLERNLDFTNICKYPNSAIRVFVRLLRNEEAPISMGKLELADLCVNWKCKKRHYWCLLELGRVSSSPTSCAKMKDVERGGGVGQNKGSTGHKLATELKGNASDRHYAGDDSRKSDQNDWPYPQGGSPKPGLRLPDASGIVKEEWGRPGETTVEPQAQSTRTPGIESGFSMPCRRDLNIATKRSDGAVGISPEGLDIRAVPPACGDGIKRSLTDGESAPEVVGGTLRREDAPRSAGPALHLNECNSAFAIVNDKTPQGVKGRKRTGREPTSEELLPNLRQSGSASVFWDNVSLSEASNGLPQGKAAPVSGEPAFCVNHRGELVATGDYGRRAEAVELIQQVNPEPISILEPASDLCGENIVVITGFKSTSSKGVGSVYHGDGRAQGNGGTCPTEGRPFVSFTEPVPASNNGSRFDAMYDGTSKIASLRGENKSSERDSDFKSVGAVTTHDPDSTSTVQGTFQRQQQPRSENLASTLNEGGGISQEDVSETLFSTTGIGLGIVTDLKTAVVRPHISDIPFTSKNRTLVLPATIKQKPLSPYDDDVSPTVNNKRQTAVGPVYLAGEQNQGIKEEHLSDGSEDDLPSAVQHFGAGNDSFTCWCRICGSDMSFCRGCMCSFCRKTLQQGEDWTVVKCICDHVCHIDCALAANAAGVVKDLGLDGELSCPSCSRKVDLWPFFQKRFDLIVSLSEVANVNLKGLEKLLFQALQLLKGTEKSRYKSLEGLVEESYELTRKFPVLVLVQQLLHAIQDELRAPHSDPESMEDGMDDGLSTIATPEEIDLLKKDQLARESLDNAKRQRLLLEQVVEKVHTAFDDALNKRRQARSAARPRPELLKEKANPPVTKELIICQKTKVDQELQKLWDMRKFVSQDFRTFSALDASAGAWLESLKSQRAVVDAAQAELKHLKNLNSHSNFM